MGRTSDKSYILTENSADMISFLELAVLRLHDDSDSIPVERLSEEEWELRKRASQLRSKGYSKV